MKKTTTQLLTLLLLLLTPLTACNNNQQNDIRTSKNTQQAANHLTDAFTNAHPQTKKHANALAQALQNRQYQKALHALQTIQTRPNITLDQGIAIDDAHKNLARELRHAARNGDKQAQKTYQLLKTINRK